RSGSRRGSPPRSCRRRGGWRSVQRRLGCRRRTRCRPAGPGPPRRPGTGGGRSAGAGGRAGARIPTRPGSGRSCRSLVGSFLELGGAVGVGAVAVDQFVFVRGGRAVSPPRPGGGVDVAAARPVVDDSG